MSKRQWLCILGVWVMVFLFLGFKSTWHKPIALVTGIIIIAIAYNIPQEIRKDNRSSNSTFVDSNIKDNS